MLVTYYVLTCKQQAAQQTHQGRDLQTTNSTADAPRKMVEPQTIPTPPTASGNTNILEPTVLPVTNSEADSTFAIASMLSPLGRFKRGNNDDAIPSLSSRDATDSRVDAERDVLLRSAVALSFSDLEDGFMYRGDDDILPWCLWMVDEEEICLLTVLIL